MKYTLMITAIGFVTASSFGCASDRKIVVPKSIVNEPTPDQPQPPITQPYVVKMSDGQRTWQIEIPAQAGAPGFGVSIPLKAEGLSPPLGATQTQTEADREIAAARESAGLPPAQSSESYTATMARVRALYRKGQYELAIRELVRLDRAYPDDERILERKGTIYRKLNQVENARKAWRRVLAVNPNNQAVARALAELDEQAPE